jgi:hypothetical protein
MVARMPRYGLAASGTRSAQRIPATVQNGSSRHVLAFFDSSSTRINEHRSGLLIRGFGVRVPGGAPGLSRHYMCLLLLFSGLVGPGWVRCGTSLESNVTDLLFAFCAHAGGPAVAPGVRCPVPQVGWIGEQFAARCGAGLLAVSVRRRRRPWAGRWACGFSRRRAVACRRAGPAGPPPRQPTGPVRWRR